MATLLLRLAAPMQSWGISSQFTERDTAREPSKSGVIGVICAALGRPREADLSDLAELKMGVRVDREGLLRKDFQIAQDILQADGKKVRENPEISNRYYLADAVFLVGLEGSLNLLKEIHLALQKPHWLLYLGRKAFPPGEPVYLRDGLRDEPLLKALSSYPSLVPGPETSLRVVVETDSGEFLRQDVPLNFEKRHFSYRRVHIDSVPAPTERED
ncbi:MAG: type I-E CRISPR-associated protein Cas5/CasD [Anaerolineaceae bacterium]